MLSETSLLSSAREVVHPNTNLGLLTEFARYTPEQASKSPPNSVRMLAQGERQYLGNHKSRCLILDFQV
jgi:hypothetical protein